jgi:hypothetical protein
LPRWRRQPRGQFATHLVTAIIVHDAIFARHQLTSIGVLVLDDKGALKTHKMGSRSKAKGAGIGLLLAVVAPPTLLAGVVGGGILGAFHHKGLGLKDADKARIGAELAGGKAAVGSSRRAKRRTRSSASSPSSAARWKPST